MENDDPIYNKLNLAPLVSNGKSIELVPVDRSKGDQIEDDLDMVRSNIQDLHDAGMEALEQIKFIANSSQDPKAYRELSVLIKVLVDANRAQVDASSVRNEVMKKNETVSTEAGQTNIQNNMFVGSTAEAVEFMRKRGIVDGNQTTEE
jgi:hypothetical protein